MLKRGLVEISSSAPGEFSFRITAEGRVYSFSDLKERLECVFESGVVAAEFDVEKINQAIEHHGMFTFGKKD